MRHMTLRRLTSSPSNGTIVNVLLHNFDLYFRGRTFSCYAFAIKNALAADVPGRFSSTRTASPWRVALVKHVDEYEKEYNRLKYTHTLQSVLQNYITNTIKRLVGRPSNQRHCLANRVLQTLSAMKTKYLGGRE